jgi:membrane protease YdiL (CAAX protease family)
VLVGLEEVALRFLGAAGVSKWSGGALAIVLRILGLVVFAPAAEEVVFRGLMYSQIRKTRLKVPGAIIIPALLFAASHFSKPLAGSALYLGLLQILIDGLYFGLVRFKTNSTVLTFGLHALGNAVAALQRI